MSGLNDASRPLIGSAKLCSSCSIYGGWSTAVGLWRVWPANDEVRFVWQAALTEAAAYLDRSAGVGPVAVGGWTPETMDPPTIELTLRRDDLSLRYFDPESGVILPASPEGEPIRIVIPNILPLAPQLRPVIAPWEQAQDEFILYEFPPPGNVDPEHAADVDFGRQLKFLGHSASNTAGQCVIGGPCEFVTFWQVTATADGPRRMFLHAVSDGETVSQDDGLSAPAEHWQPGDIVIQLLALPEVTSEVRLGVYDPRDLHRLITESGAEYVVLTIR